MLWSTGTHFVVTGKERGKTGEGTCQTHFKSDLLILCIENLCVPAPQGLGGEPLWRNVFLKPSSTQAPGTCLTLPVGAG